MANTFLGVAVPEGRHKIVMKYEPQGLRLGFLITLGSVLLILACAGIGRMADKNKT